MRATAALLILSLLAIASPDRDTLFERLHRGYDPRDPGALDRAAELLREQDPQFWQRPMTAGPLRGALARRLTRAEAVALLLAPAPPAVPLQNLSFREDIGAVVIEAELLPRLLPDHRGLVIQIAIDSLIDGDRRLAVALLGDEPSVTELAGALDNMHDPEGLRLLADVVTGEVPIPAGSLATLAEFDPDTHNRYHARPLGAARVRALGKAAGAQEDGAIRALAARLLHASLEPAVFKNVVRAYRDADSWRIDDTEWMKIGSNFRMITADPGVAIERKAAMLEGCFVWSHERARSDPLATDRIAAHLRQVAAVADPALLDLMAQILEDHPTVAVGGDHGRRRPVPSYRGLLEDLTKHPGLPRQVARRLLATLEEERSHGHRQRFVLPKERAKSADDLRKLLADPPKTFEQYERGDQRWHRRTGLDPSGVIPRSLILRAHARSPILWSVLSDVGLVASWPYANRREVERLRAEREEWDLRNEEEDCPDAATLCARLLDREIPWRERVRDLERGLSIDEDHSVSVLATFIMDGAPYLDSDLPEIVIEGMATIVQWMETRELDAAFGIAVDRVPAQGPRIRLRRMLELWEENR